VPRAELVDRDIDIASLLRIRVVNAPEPIAARIARQFGVQPALATPAAADLTVRFVDRRGDRSVHLIGLRDAAWDSSGYYVLDGNGRRARIPFDALGPGCAVLVEHGFAGVPLLVPLVNVLMLARGILPLHASSVVVGAAGIAAAGWSKGGKTEALLALLGQGAAMVADEWTYVEPVSRRIHGAPGPVRLQDWHLEQLKDLRARVDRQSLRRMRWAGRTRSAHAAVRRPLKRLPGSQYVDRAARLLEDELHVDVPAEVVHEGRRGLPGATLDTVLWVVAGDVTDTTVQATAAADVAARMVHSHQHHRLSLLSAYSQYRFAFPDTPSSLVESLEEREADLLRAALDGVRAYEVLHPARPSIASLGRAIADVIGSSARDA
jgi:hypothetical protein